MLEGKAKRGLTTRQQSLDLNTLKLELGSKASKERATSASDGLMSKEDKAKLDGISSIPSEGDLNSILEQSKEYTDNQINTVNETISGIETLSDEDVKRVITESPNEIKTGFNKITESIQINEDSIQLMSEGNKALRLRYGRMNIYDSSNGNVSGYIGQTHTMTDGQRNSGIVFGGSANCTYATFVCDTAYSNDSQDTGTQLDVFMNFVFKDYGANKKGIQFNQPTFFSNKAPITVGNIKLIDHVTFESASKTTIGTLDKPAYRVFCNSIRSGGNSFDIFAKTDNYGGLRFSDAGYLTPTQNAGLSLGTDTLRYHTIYLRNSPNVSSDANAKEEISYIGDNSGTYTIEGITTGDMYNFIKDRYRIAEFYYKDAIDRNEALEGKKELGFIAQDLEGDKVGERIIRRSEDGQLSYNTSSFENVIAGALQEAIKEIEILKSKIK